MSTCDDVECSIMWVNNYKLNIYEKREGKKEKIYFT